MYLYLLESDGFYKVGVAKNVKVRLGDLQCGNPHKINLVATCKVDQPYHVEWMIHRVFSGIQVHGEWFALSGDNVELLKETFVMLEKDDDSILDTMRRRWKEAVPQSFRSLPLA